MFAQCLDSNGIRELEKGLCDGKHTQKIAFEEGEKSMGFRPDTHIQETQQNTKEMK